MHMTNAYRVVFGVLVAVCANSVSAHDNDAKSVGNAAQAGSGGVGPYASRNVQFISNLSLDQIGSESGSVIGNDIWGWTDADSRRQFAIFGLTNGTSFIEVTDAENPVFLGKLATHEAGQNRAWRDMKVFDDHAFIVADGNGNDHGMQVFDLKQLLDVTTPQTFSETAHYDGFGRAHNIAINESTGYAYVTGSNTDAGGLHIVDLNDTQNYNFSKVGGFSADGYTHDTQVVSYSGPDADYAGREIAFNSNEDTLTIVDVTNKASTLQISRTGYGDSEYSHQGWLSEDQQYFFMNDELDEYRHIRGPDGQLGTADDLPPIPTKTHMWDVSDLDNPNYIGFYEGTESTIDHNLYVMGDYIYQANYTSGLRILEMTDVENGILTEVGFFDSFSRDNNVSFNGAWSVFPFFGKDKILISDRQGGLFIVRQVPEPTSWALVSLLVAGAACRRRVRS